MAQHYEIAISGGGIAGVTLALMCEKLNISYILLEGRDSLESDRGAGIGMQPNGLRILDQLGIADEIEAATVPIEHTYVYDDAGNLLSSSGAVGRFTERIGYPLMFIERPKLLSIMVSHIKRKDCIRTDARVCSVEEADDHVRVTTTNGLSITADIVVGADGVRSAVRGYVDSYFSKEKTFSADDYIDVGFSAVYGMTPPIKGIAPGERFVVSRENQNAIGFTGTDGVVFWIVFENHHKLIPMSQAPRYTDAEAEALCQSVAHVQITPHLKFGDLLPDRTVCIKIAVEEGVADRWHTNRAVIVGDAGLKTTPAGGQGANQGIESCAVLLNNLVKAKQACAPGEKLSSEAIKSALTAYAEERINASRIALQKSQFLCKAMLCMPGPAEMFRGLMSLPEDEWLLRILSDQANAPILDNVELTARGQLYSKTAAELRAEMAKRMEAARQATEVRAEKEIIQEAVRQAIVVE